MNQQTETNSDREAFEMSLLGNHKVVNTINSGTHVEARFSDNKLDTLLIKTKKGTNGECLQFYRDVDSIILLIDELDEVRHLMEAIDE